MAIIADVFAGIQIIIASTGAGEVQNQYGDSFNYYSDVSPSLPAAEAPRIFSSIAQLRMSGDMNTLGVGLGQ